MQANKNKGPIKKGPPPATTGRNNVKNGKLQPLKNTDRGGGSPSLRGANKKVVPGIKDEKAKEKEQAALMSSILSGKYASLPPKRPTEVRVFLSSTFVDMREERNTLMRQANPELKDYCFQKHGLDFSMVDMRWGVTDEATNDHSTEEICLREIHNCQRVGLGPTFVTILGDRYGYRPIPKTVNVSEMDEVIIPEVSDKSRVTLLHKWYKRDDNAVPAQYVLQPVTSHIPEFGTGGPADNEWWSQQTELGETLRNAIQSAKEKGKVTVTKQHEYNMSVTESEIWRGIVKAKQPELHCLFFLRRFKNLDNDALNVEKTAAKRYIDNIKTPEKALAIDLYVAQMRQALHTDVIPKNLTGGNIYKYPPLEWDIKGVVPDEAHKDHKEYIENFCKDFTIGLKTLIEKDKQEMEIHTGKTKYYSNFDEILHHVHFVKAKVETFRGQEGVLKAVKEHMVSGKRVPFVIYAESGGGKTSIMAKIFDLLPNWFGKDVSRVIRFLGTSPLSTDIYDVLWSVVGQVADNYQEIVQPSCYKTLKGIIQFIPRLLRTLKKDKNEKLVILLDSVDQLSGENDAFKMKWLPTDLPSNVHIIISTIPSLHGILDNCHKIGLPASAMWEVSALNEAEGKEIVAAYLDKSKRKIQQEQETALINAYTEVKNVLYLKLLMDKAVTWQSYTKVDTLMKDIGTSVRAAINHLYGTLETKFGATLISHTLGYLTVGLSGLTNVELEDALSCDNEVLDKVYQYHPPPVEGIIRFPPVLWPRIKYDIEEYLTERNSQGKNTLFWYHRQFIEAAQDRYAGGGAGKKFHRNLAELFLAENEMKKGITLTSPRVKRTIKNADRQISKHPVDSDNKRTLVAACYHFQNSEDVEGLKKNIVFNYKFLLAKIQSEGVKSILEEIAKLLKMLESRSMMEYDYDLEMIRACLLDFDDGERNRIKVRNQILCCMPQVSWLPMSKTLREQAMDEVLNLQSKLPVPLPMHPFLFYKASMAQKYEGVPEVLQAYNDVLCCEPTKPEKNQQNLINIGKKKPVRMRYGGISGIVCAPKNPEDVFVFRSSYYYYAKSYKYPYTNITKSALQVNEKGELKISYSTGITLKVEFLEHNEKYRKYELEAVWFSSQEELCIFLLSKDMLVLHGHKEERKSFKMTYQIHSKTDSPKKRSDDTHIRVGINGSDVEVKQAIHSDLFNKTLALIQSQDDSGVTLTTLCVMSIDDSKVQKATIQLPGKPYQGKMQLTSDETTLIFAIEMNDGSGHKIYKYHLDKTKYSPFMIEGHVKALSFTSIGPIIWYALTQNKILGYDCATERQCFSVDFDSSLATALRVEDDGEFVYVGDSTGRVHAWQVDCKHYLGYTSFNYGGIRGIFMSHADVNIALHTEENLLLTIPQRHFIDQCVRNLQGENNKKHNAPSDELDKLCTAYWVQIFDSGSMGTVLVTFESTCCKVWDIKTLEKMKEIPYGGETLESCQVVYNGKQHCVVYNETKALLMNTDTFKFSLVPDLTNIQATCQSEKGILWFLTKREENKVDIKMLKPGDTTVTFTYKVKDSLSSEKFELMTTPEEKYVILKVKCSEKELDIIEASEKKTNGSAELAGEFKFYAVDVSKETEEVSLIPCLKNLSKVLCLGQTCVPYPDNTVLIVMKSTINFWNIEAKKNLPRLIKGKNAPMFELVSKDKMKEEDLEPEITDAVYHTGTKRLVSITKRKKFYSNSSHDSGTVDAFKESGEHMTPNWWKNKHNNPDDILERLTISPDGSYALTTSKSNTLKCWHVENCCKETFCIQLDVKVTQMTYSSDGKYAALLGEGDKRTKVMVFKVKPN